MVNMSISTIYEGEKRILSNSHVILFSLYQKDNLKNVFLVKKTNTDLMRKYVISHRLIKLCYPSFIFWSNR